MKTIIAGTLLVLGLYMVKQRAEFYFKCKNLDGIIVNDSILGQFCMKREVLDWK